MKQIEKEKKNNIQQLAIKALIGFFIIMGIFTALSRIANTITIPSVSVSSPKNGRLDHAIEVKGNLSAKNEVNLQVSAGFMIKEVKVEKGDRVEEGDTLVVLDDKNIKDKSLQLALELKRLDLQMQQLDLDVPVDTIGDPIKDAEVALSRLEEDREENKTSEERNREEALEELQLAEEELRIAKEQLEKFKNKNTESQLKEAQEAVTKAKKDLENIKFEKEQALKRAQMTIDDAYNAYNEITTGSSYIAYQAVERARKQYTLQEEEWNRKIKEVEEQLKEKEAVLKKLKNGEIEEETIRTEEEKIKTAERNVVSKKKALEKVSAGTGEGVQKVDRLIEDAQKELALAKEKSLQGQTQKEKNTMKINLQKSLLLLEKEMKQREYDTLKELENMQGVVKAPSGGVVTGVKATVGDLTTGGYLVNLVVDSDVYVLEVAITEEMAKRIEVGDMATVTLEGEDLGRQEVAIESIGNMPDESGKKKKLSVTLTEGEHGMDATLTLNKQTEKYPFIFPKEAIRQDVKGSYVLVAREKNTTLGTQLIVERVEVTELDSNADTIAVQGALNTKDKIVTRSNKPIVAGDPVRLKD